MIIDPGTGGSITATTIERYTFALVAWGHNIEASNSKNPNQVNYLSSNRDDETGVVSGNITIPCNIVMQSDGSSKYNYPNPYGDTGFTPGTGAQIKGQNFIEVLVNSFLFQILAELNPEKNTTGQRYITSFDHSLNTSTTLTTSTANATLSIAFNFPTIATPGANGVSIVAMNYLQD